jgi:CubicO group peptidase (beta-lactamase class C family)
MTAAPSDLNGLDVEARMAHHAVPGAALALLVDGELAEERAYGVLEAGRAGPVTTTTRFQACSISKPVAVLGLLRLVERGVVDLDADVNDYLTSWRIPPNASWQPRITLEQIASHSAGLTVHGFPGYASGAPLPTLTQILSGTSPANTPGVRVDTVPGLHFRYAGGGTTVLQQVLENVTGRPFAELMQELVLEPVGMTHSTYAQPLPLELQGEAATAHDADGNPVAGRWHVYPELAAAGLWTTPGDLARYAIAVQRAVAGEPGAILGQELAESMLARRMRTGALIRGLDSVGLGLFLGGDPAPIVFGHSGGNEGFKCHLLAHREAGWGAAVMTNGERGHFLVEEILDELASTMGWEDYEESGPLDLDRLTGTYEARPGAEVVVTRRGNDLAVSALGQPAIRFVPTSETEYASFSVETTVRFEQIEDGTPTLVVRQNGQDVACRRVGPA